MAFWILSSYTCRFKLCYSSILFASKISFPVLKRFFSLSFPYYSYFCFLMARAFSVSYLSFILASSGVNFGWFSACPAIKTSSSKSKSYLWSSIHFSASVTLTLSILKWILTCEEQCFLSHVFGVSLGLELLAQLLIDEMVDGLGGLRGDFLIGGGILVLFEPLFPFLFLFAMV